MYRPHFISNLNPWRIFIKQTAFAGILCLWGLLLNTSVLANGSVDLKLCQSCHGNDLAGNTAIGAPNLTGLSSAYIAKQLLDFKSGARGNHATDSYGQQMRATTKTLNDAQIEQLAQTVAQMATIPRLPTETANSKGKNIFLANCAACHHSTAKGNPALGAPALNVQSKAYLVRQLNHFREGIRGTEKSDQRGRQMAMMAKTITSEEDLLAVVNYILSISNN